MQRIASKTTLIGLLVVILATCSVGCFSKVNHGTGTKAQTSPESSRESERKARNWFKRGSNRSHCTPDEIAALQDQVVRLERRLQNQQRLLEEAINDVVRERAKQLSVESRAKAASEMAEAEIALKGAQATQKNTRDISRARTLLLDAGKQFKAENFGGALYLAMQAKSSLRSPAITDAVRQIEKAFKSPLSMTAAKRSNFRTGPGKEFSVLRQVDAGEKLTGLGESGEWLRARCQDGRVGWIHRSLVSSRD